MTDDEAREATQEIVQEIDKSLLLGAAYDCMSEPGKLSFQNKVEAILKQEK